MLKSVLPLMFAAALTITGCGSSNTNQDAVPDLAPDKLYQVAQASMASGEFSKAIRYLNALDTRYPFGELTDQLQLDLIYCYYKSRESAMTTAAINRYLRLNPTGQYNDYVMYMKGLNEIQMHSSLIQDFMGLNRAQKDPTTYYEAMKTFRRLIEEYPDSPYVKDARQRMIYIRDQLAEREFKIAKYYYDREAYLSSVRRCQSILYSFRDTQYLQPALELMSKGYRKLGLDLPASNTDRVINDTYYHAKK